MREKSRKSATPILKVLKALLTFNKNLNFVSLKKAIWPQNICKCNFVLGNEWKRTKKLTQNRSSQEFLLNGNSSLKNWKRMGKCLRSYQRIIAHSGQLRIYFDKIEFAALLKCKQSEKSAPNSNLENFMNLNLARFLRMFLKWKPSEKSAADSK